MALDPSNGVFSFEFGEKDLQPYLDVGDSLSPMERAQLRALAGEGGPLTRIILGMVDISKHIEVRLAFTDLTDPQGFAQARALQAEYRSNVAHRQMWERILSDPTVGQPEAPAAPLTGDEAND